MIIAVWIASGLLALANLGAGFFKLSRSKEALASSQPWTVGFSTPVIKLIGTAEVLAAIGLIVPPLTGIVPILAPLAAVGVVILQLGAIVTHLRIGERMIVPNVVILLLALFVALARFGVFGAL
jgi:hypothetical protein